MSKVAEHVTLAGISLDRRGNAPLAAQLYDSLRQAILRGQFRPGTRLPSTRLLASEFGVSRNTVMGAYEQLLAEGYVEARVGSGTVVARSLPDEMLSVSATALPRKSGEAPASTPAAPRGSRRMARTLSDRGKQLSIAPVRVLTLGGAPRPFASGLPDIRAFPVRIWSRLLAQHWRKPGFGLLGFGDPAGYEPLRAAIAAHLRVARAVRCETEQVVVVNGSQQALDLTARLIIDAGDSVLMEDPGYPGARVAFKGAGAKLARLPVDEHGADIQRVRGHAGETPAPHRLVFCTPSHQFPLGATMTLPRRLALLEWANRAGAWILEDDYDSEYRYRGKPLPSLQGLDGTGRVIYMGSFSKTLFPSLRLGFLVLPPDLVEAFRRARSVIDGHPPVTEQVVLADFIAQGHFARHIRRMRALYEERQAVLVEAAQQELAGVLDVRASEGGMHLVGWLPQGIDDVAASHRAAAHGIVARPLSSCALVKGGRGGLLLGYASLTPRQIREGVKKLAEALHGLQRSQREP